jgi:hypothetical protein
MRTWLSGRVLASQAEDREFESRRPLHMKSQGVQGFLKGILNPFSLGKYLSYHIGGIWQINKN